MEALQLMENQRHHRCQKCPLCLKCQNFLIFPLMRIQTCPDSQIWTVMVNLTNTVRVCLGATLANHHVNVHVGINRPWVATNLHMVMTHTLDLMVTMGTNPHMAMTHTLDPMVTMETNLHMAKNRTMAKNHQWTGMT